MANTQTLTIPFHLPAAEPRPSRDSDLGYRIALLIEQRGHFKNVTEQNILSQGSGDEEGTAPNDDASLNEQEELTPQKRNEKLWGSRVAMLQQYDRGMNELLTTLDFMSLLISKQSASAKAGMSPGIQAAKVPSGSFEPKVVKAPEPLKSKTQQEAEVSQGWKAKGFESAFKKFSAASQRLKREAERESRFWAEAASLKEKGWRISRHPRDSKAVGVHFGLAESATQYRNQGFALLRQDENGDTYLDRATTSSQKRLRVSIERDGHQTASYCPPGTQHDVRNDASRLVIEARDQLLDEELFQEISREARLVSNQDVTARGQVIAFGIGNDCRVILSHGDVAVDSSTHGEDEDLAQCIRTTLKSLLLSAHEACLEQRSRTPRPTAARQSSIPEMMLLRPAIANMRHQASMISFSREFMTPFVKPLQVAGVEIKLEPKSRNDGEPDPSPGGQLSLLATRPLTDTFSLSLPDGQTLEVGLTTFTGQPVYGTRYKISDAHFGFARVTAKTYGDLSAGVTALRQILLLALVKLAQSSSLPNGTWEVTLPQKGELSYISKTTKQVTSRLRIQLQSNVLTLRALLAARTHNTAKKIVAWSWNDDGTHMTGKADMLGTSAEEATKMSFLDVLTQLAKA